MRLPALAVAALFMTAPLAVAADYPPPRTIQLPNAAHWFGGFTLIDQDGRARRLYEDLMAGQLVVVNPFFTGCRAACPVVMHNVALLQSKAEIEGIDARFISITVDPDNEPPASLRPYADSLGAKPGWYLLSGEPDTVRQALHRFGLDADPTDPDDHLNMLYIANLKTGVWKKVFSVTPPDELARILEAVAAGGDAPPR
jgi:cytochrome oxidase Cu insertion factor (SCO1/SenC/PrrC family)